MGSLALDLNKMKSKISDLENEKKYQRDEIITLKSKISKLETDKENMETNCSICHSKTYSIDWHMKTYHSDVPWQPAFNGV